MKATVALLLSYDGSTHHVNACGQFATRHRGSCMTALKACVAYTHRMDIKHFHTGVVQELLQHKAFVIDPRDTKHTALTLAFAAKTIPQ